MASDMAICVLFLVTTFSLSNGGLDVSRQRLEEESSKPCNREKCDRLKTMLEEQVESYQFACGANNDPPKVEPVNRFLDRVGKSLATAYMQIPQATKKKLSPHEATIFVKNFYRSCTNLPTGFTTEPAILECIGNEQCVLFLSYEFF